jgi:hypothetical protein
MQENQKKVVGENGRCKYGAKSAAVGIYYPTKPVCILGSFYNNSSKCRIIRQLNGMHWKA